MPAKPETKLYVTLGKVLAAVKNSKTLKDANMTYYYDEPENAVIFSISVNGKTLGYTLPINSTKEQKDVLDEIMGIYNVQL